MAQRRTVRLLALVALLLAVLALCAAAAEPAGQQAGSGNRVAFRMHEDTDDDDDDNDEDADTGVRATDTAEAEDEQEAQTEDAAAEAEAATKSARKPATRRRARRVHADDDDEFEGTEEVRKQQKHHGPQRIALGELRRRQQMAEAAAKQQQPGQTAEGQQQQQQKPRDWRMEMVMGSIAAAYLLWFAVGAVANTRQARRWLRNSRAFLDEQFAQLGDPYRGVADLERDSFNQFYLQATGRVNCIGARFSLDVCHMFLPNSFSLVSFVVFVFTPACLLALAFASHPLSFLLIMVNTDRPTQPPTQMKHRQDLMTSITGLFLGRDDRVTLDAVMPSGAPLVLAMMKNREKKRMTDDFRDLAAASVTEASVERLNAAHVSVLTDNTGALEALVDDPLVDTIVRHADLFVSLHVSDRSTIYATHKNVLRAVLRLPRSDADQARLVELMAAVMAFVDIVSTMKMSKGAQARATAVRQAEKRERERRAAEEKKEAADRAKEERREREYKAMTPEQRAKADEKARRRQEKKRVRVVKM